MDDDSFLNKWAPIIFSSIVVGIAIAVTITYAFKLLTSGY